MMVKLVSDGGRISYRSLDIWMALQGSEWMGKKFLDYMCNVSTSI